MNSKNKKALLIVSFGTSYPQAIENCIEPVEAAMAQMAPDYDVFRAFTSGMIIQKLKKVFQMNVCPPEEALEMLAGQGYTVIAVQPTHILAGVEYHDLAAQVERFGQEHPEIQVSMGQPLLFENEDYSRAAAALETWMPRTKEDEVVLLMGHGTEHFSNSAYFALQHYLDALETHAVYVANVEAPPILDEVMQQMKHQGVNRVYLMPFMLVAGDHARNDMAGDDKASWQNRLLTYGFEVEVILRGLGESEAFCRLYAQKAAKLLDTVCPGLQTRLGK